MAWRCLTVVGNVFGLSINPLMEKNEALKMEILN